MRLSDLKAAMLSELQRIYTRLDKLDGSVNDLVQDIDRGVDYILQFRDFLVGEPLSPPQSMQSPPRSVQVDAESSDIYSEAFNFISMLDGRPELQRALEVAMVWSETLNPHSRAILLIQAAVDNRIKRVHDQLAQKCLNDPQSQCGIEDEAFPLLEWMIEASSLSRPKAKSIDFEFYEGNRYDGGTMKSPKAVVSGVVSRTLLPGVPRMKLKGVVEVSQ